MDNQTPTSPIPRIRTYAKDLDKKRSLNTDSSETLSQNSVPNPPTSPNQKEDHTYKAPSWTGNKSAQKNKPIDESLRPTKQESETPNQFLTDPLQKSSGDVVVIDSEGASTAVIISDTKKNRFRLLPSILASLKSWFKEANQKREADKIPQYTVPDASLRQGVIQKATSRTGKLTNFDHTSIQARIRERQARAVPKTPTTIWTANTEPGYPLLEAPAEKITNVEIEPKRSVYTTLPAPELITPPPVTEIPTSPSSFMDSAGVGTYSNILPDEVTDPNKINEPEQMNLINSEVSVETVNLIPQATNPTVLESIQSPIETEATNASVTDNIKQAEDLTEISTQLKPNSLKEWLFIINTNLISLGIAGLVLAFSLIAIVGYYWYQTNLQTIEITISPSHPVVLDSPLQLVTLPSKQKDSLVSSVIQNYAQSSYSVLQLLFVDPANRQIPVPAPLILNLLGSNLNTAFTQSVSRVYFGGVKQTQPFIILAVSDPDTARGGMLAWEQTILEDLQPLFLDMNLATTDIRNLKFTDLVIDNTDIRLVEDPTGRTVLLYGIINSNNLLITSQVSTYQELVKLIK